ncbi:hypothetical protein LAJ19_15780 (plasmid) [Deinococcus taeanensis]|uniref:hypothetical protein n=1 Tax=Deinococcus taeanensis TaxID=2737050 RepID=UPI001CDB6856|nr:hypothetical protein [Deinococcus taeanensis]UBV44627.1 hypothetical protein LAJ19_15780 [Deinococcus taeanensis]
MEAGVYRCYPVIDQAQALLAAGEIGTPHLLVLAALAVRTGRQIREVIPPD